MISFGVRVAASIALVASCLFAIFGVPAATEEHTMPIYADALAHGWQDHSWATVNLAASTVTHAGTRSIAVTYTGAWQALQLRYPELPTTGYGYLRFFLYGGSGGQKIDFFVTQTVNGAAVDGPKQRLPVVAGRWMQIDLPLADLGTANAPITGLTWTDASGSKQPTWYLDDLMLVNRTDADALALSAGSMLPNAVPADGTTGVVVRVQVAHAVQDTQVTLDGSSVGAGTVVLHDDGRSNDGAANDGIYGAILVAARGTAPGERLLAVTAQNISSSTSYYLGTLTMLQPPGGTIPTALPQRLGWGTNQWSFETGKDWQVNSNAPFDYVNQYVNYEWYRDGWGGDFVQRFVQQAWSKRYVPVISFYTMLTLPPACGESAACYATKLQNADAVRTYLAALAEAARQARGDAPVIMQLEPDFYGFMQNYSNSADRPSGVRPDDPSSFPVALNSAGYPNTLAGFGQRMVDLVHETAPNVLVAPHISMWGSRNDPNTVTAEQTAQLAQRSAAFVDAMGGRSADMFTVEWSDADAGSGKAPWWDATDRQLPRVSRALWWENALSVAANKRLLLWQMPAGNMSLDNTCSHYRDNRAAYAFDHSSELWNAGVLGVVFGGGNQCMTSAATDGGFIAAQATIAYAPPAAPRDVAAQLVHGASVQVHWSDNSEPDFAGYTLEYQNSHGMATTIDVGRRTSATLVLPSADTWSIRVVARDTLGNRAASAPVSIATTAAPHTTFVPLAQ